jgi:hypothetical protein
MTPFYTPKLELQHIPATHWWKPTRWQLLKGVTILGHYIPKGFEFDGASVPRILWWLFPPAGRYMVAALLHDYLLKQNTVSRAFADAMFLLVMKLLGVTLWRRAIMYGAVRIFGILKGVLND